MLTVYGGKEATDEVAVEVRVPAHVIDFLPLTVCHLVTNHLCRHLLPTLIATPQLQRGEGEI